MPDLIPCARAGCEMPAARRLVAILPAPRPHPGAFRCVISLAICEGHSLDQPMLDAVLTPELKRDLSDAIFALGYLRPDLTRARVETVALDAQEVLDADLARASLRSAPPGPDRAG